MAKIVSEEAAKYNLYETQCIWYAFMVFRSVPPVKQKGDYQVELTVLESLVKKVMKSRNIPRLSAMLETLEEGVQKSIVQTSTYPVDGLVVEPANPLSSTSEVAEDSSTDLSPMAADSSSVVTDLSSVATDLSSVATTSFSTVPSESTTTLTTEPETQRKLPDPSLISKLKGLVKIPRSTNNGAMQLA